MIFKNRSPLYEDLFDGEIVGELTVELDKLAGFKIHPEAMLKHYLEVPTDLKLKDGQVIPIKVANLEVGSITIEKDNCIKCIDLDLDSHPLIQYGDGYFCDTMFLRKYIGERISVVLDEN